MSRTQNVKRNLIFNMIKYVSQLLLRFVSRTILIYAMGAEYIGLDGLFSNIFQFLNLAELGVGSAIVFAMYKPIAENDVDKVKTLQNLYKKFYLIIALVVLVVGGVLTPFLNIFIKNDVSVDINIYILFVMYLFNSVVGYLSAHKRSLLLAYERNDIENKIKTICLFAMTAIQIIVLLIFKNYYIYYLIAIISTIIECVIIHVVANKYYPEINGKNIQPIDAETKKLITKNVAALSIHKIGGAVVFSTDNILISSFFGIVVLGAYSNYTLIINSFLSIFTLLTNALSGSVGNLIASTSTEYTFKKYRQTNFLFSFLSAFCTICMFVLFQPFVRVWTGGGKYLLDFSTMALLCVSFYLSRMRCGTNVFKDCAGLFWNDKWKPIVESVVNLGVSIGLAYLIGINGIVIGTIISTLVAPFWWEPYVLYKYYFKKSPASYFKYYLLDVLIMALVGAVCYFTCLLIPDRGIWLLLAKFAVCIVLSLGLLCLCYCWTPEFKDSVKMFKGMLKRKTKVQEQFEIFQSNADAEEVVLNATEKNNENNERSDENSTEANENDAEAVESSDSKTDSIKQNESENKKNEI